MKKILLSFCWAFLISPAFAQSECLRARIADVLRGKKATVGVAVIIDGKDTVVVNDDDLYPMMSVFKFHQALAVADYLKRNGMGMEHQVRVKRKDLHKNTYSPLRDRFPKGGVSLSVGELLTYTLQQSDNNACDILFDFAGGPQRTDEYIRSLGFSRFAIVANEDDMHRDLNLCYENRTSPLEMARLLEWFVSASGQDDAGLTFIKNVMLECRTGTDRLPFPLKDTGARIGHKTGTGDRNAQGKWIGLNDAGFVFLPDGRRYTVAVFVKDSAESMEGTTRIIADISGVVYRYVMDEAASRP